MSNGLFTVTLDFGAGVFDGNERWLEIGVRTNGGGGFNALTPRQPITSSPYAIQSLNAATATSADSANSAATAGSATTAGTANNFSGALAGDVTGTQGATVISSVGGVTAANVAGGANAANAATSADTANAIVKRDASGNFSAGTITANLSGNATTATTAANLTGNIADTQLPANIARLNGTNVFSATNTFSGVVIATNANNVIGGSFTGTLPATQLTGTVPDGALSANVSKLGSSIDSSEIADGTIVTNDFSSSVLNGTFWKLGGNTGISPDTQFLGTTDNQPLEFKVNNQRGLRLEQAIQGDDTSVNVIGGAYVNSVAAGVVGATIAGGGTTNVGGFAFPNWAMDDFTTIGGGYFNTAGGNWATIAGGEGNATGNQHATVGGGFANNASGDTATIGGGFYNAATGLGATIPGGDNNTATNQAFAAGHRAKANHPGAFVWADSTDADFASTGNNQFLIRATGGVGIGTTAPDRPLAIQGTGVNGEWMSFKDTDDVTRWHLNNKDGGLNFAQTGVADGRLFLSTNGSVYVNNVVVTSDRNAKENFAPVDPRGVLAKVSSLPITEWNFKTSTDVRHIGPMAQDFHAAFGLNAERRPAHRPHG